jgi:hypothetical protein
VRVLVAVALGLAVACSAAPAPSTPEGRLRARLGIPPEAKQVVLFAQAAHLDIDWQQTFDGYYQNFVEDIFREARQILDSQPRAYYSVAEMAYLERHLEVHPEELPPLARHVARGALRIVGGGRTSPDTLLPETELVLRDFLHGTRFAEEVLGVRPSAAWLPDSFGHAATVPDLLAAAGFDSVGFARVDGAPTFFESVRDPAGPPPPRPGSTAEELTALGSADFVWRGPGGGSVLAHWIAAGLYCTGDNIDYDEVIQLPGGHPGVYDGDEPSFTDGRIDSYVAQLAPTARTPYLFVPVGCDFQHPKVELLSYLDGYNRRRYPRTGVYAVAAPFDDYVALVAAHRDALPERAGGIEPYFMGFYGTRADVKARVRAAARPLVAAETFAVALGADAAATAPIWKRLVLSDHHDFLTGTANDEVTASEQLPLLAAADDAGRAAFAEVADALGRRLPANADAVARLVAFNPAGVAVSGVVDVRFGDPLPPVHAVADGRSVPLEVLRGRGHAITLRFAVADLPPLGWRAVDLVPGAAPADARVTLQLSDDAGRPASGAAVTRVVLANERVRAEWRRADGWALAVLQIDGADALADRSFTVGDYADQGGLWRLGNEMDGCTLTPLAPPDGEAAGETVQVLDRSRLSARVAFVGPSATREARLDAGDAGLQLALTTAARMATTRTATFRFAVAADAPLRTSLAGGFAERVPSRVYTPTFWPAVEWVSVGPWAILLRQSTGARLSASGEAELMAARDARSEHCDLEGGMGSDPGSHRIEWVVTRADDPAAATRAAQAFNRPPLVARASAASGAADLPVQGSLAGVDADGAGVITALKPAERGGGVILRALLLPGPLTVHLGPALAGRARTRTDAVERDLEPLDGVGDTLVLDRERFGAIATVRLR